jgi:Survival motor neuron (SMN) interacting protein 1 (SIP1)
MAPPQKRKRGYSIGDDDDDDDTSCGLRQILPVANLPADFDGEPVDGMQYLFTVRFVLSIYYCIDGLRTKQRIRRRDARKLPDVKFVANPYNQIPPQPAQSMAQACTEPTRQVQAPPPLPTKEWRSEFERHFCNFRGVSL